MEMNARLALTLSGIFMFGAVALGAFGAHALRGQLDPQMSAVWQSAVQYHAWHGLALLGVGCLLLHWPGRRGLGIAAWLFTLGIVLFAGSLYGLVIGFALSALGFGFTRPGFTAGSSLGVSMAEQGSVAGVITAANGIAFVAAPGLGMLLYGVDPRLPFAVSVLLLLILAAWARARL